MKNDSKTGLTPPEKIALAIIIILAAVVVLPKFCSLSEESKRAAEKQDVSRIRIAITDYYIDAMLKNKTPLFPATLDSAKIGYASPENLLFTNVLVNHAIKGGGWRKLGSTIYESYSRIIYTYNPATGSFNE
jgi:hypothetical protein